MMVSSLKYTPSIPLTLADLEYLTLPELRSHLRSAPMMQILEFAKTILEMPHAKIRHRGSRSEFIEDILEYVRDLGFFMDEPSCAEPDDKAAVVAVIRSIRRGEYDLYLKEIAKAAWDRKLALDATPEAERVT